MLSLSLSRTSLDQEKKINQKGTNVKLGLSGV